MKGSKDSPPNRLEVSAGIILIDNSLVAEGAVKGRENFTVIHECFHQFLAQPGHLSLRYAPQDPQYKPHHATKFVSETIVFFIIIISLISIF